MRGTLTIALTTVCVAGLGGASLLQVWSQPQLKTPGKVVAAPTKTETEENARAESYFDLPLSRLKEAVPGLRGLKYESGQEALPRILSGVSQRIGAMLTKLPDLASRETVYHFQTLQDSSHGSGVNSQQPWSREFNYLLLCRRYADGSMRMEESRADGRGKSVGMTDIYTAPRSYGFAYQWLLFSAANQQEFRFRYLGEQEKEGKSSYVVAFAQIPKKVIDPAYFQSMGKMAPFYYQGVLWVDRASFEIVMLRTDLLAPLPELQLRQLTTEVHFAPAAIRGYGEVFWLPQRVEIASDQGAGPAEESHRYSNYHLFHSEAKIVTLQ